MSPSSKRRIKSQKQAPRTPASYKSPSPAWPDDPVKALMPDITPESQRLFQTLQGRAQDIQNWFAADPERVGELQSNPYQTLSELSHALGITLPSALAADLPTITVLRNPLQCVCDTPSTLFSAVWRFVGASVANRQAWSANPFSVIRTVATNTNASAQDLNALIYAFQRVFGVSFVTIANLAQLTQVATPNQPTQVVVQQS